MRRTIVLLTALGMMMPLAAHALNEHVWLMVNGGGGTYNMSELNAEVDAANAANAGSGFVFNQIKSGKSLGIAAGFDTPNGWNYGLGIDRLYATSKASDANGSMVYQFNANAWHVFAERAFHVVGRSSMLVGAGLGIIAESGKLVDSDFTTGPVTYKLTGASPMAEAHGGGNWWVTPQFGLVATAGYRYARIKEIREDGGTFITTTGEAMAVDYSGPYARVGFKLAGKNVGD